MSLRFQLKEKNYIVARVRFILDLNESTAELLLEDSTELDFLDDVESQWYSSDSSFGGLSRVGARCSSF